MLKKSGLRKTSFSIFLFFLVFVFSCRQARGMLPTLWHPRTSRPWCMGLGSPHWYATGIHSS